VTVLDGPRRERRRVVVGGRVCDALVDGDRLVLADGRRVAPDSVAHLAPVTPTTIVCVHLNHRSRAVELGRDLADEHPTYFLKPAATVNGHGGELVRPGGCELLNYEGELAAVVGRPMRAVAAPDVWDHLAGFCVANDVGVHDFRGTDAGSMLRVKGHDGFCPLGPGLVGGVDVRRARLRTWVNDVVVQDATLDEMTWGIDTLLADVTRYLTLQPGDVVLTGTPWHSRPMFPGDTVAVEVEGIGRLVNQVVAGPPAGSEGSGGYPPTVTKAALAVALGSDYHRLRSLGETPSARAYHSTRATLTPTSLATGPP
jgi:5-oxopent-3-ene-1,2,5-tricarboxylate decarboxylase/2-hydroxyhepta-2,4-diene-1,7-dioate isomerase